MQRNAARRRESQNELAPELTPDPVTNRIAVIETLPTARRPVDSNIIQLNGI